MFPGFIRVHRSAVTDPPVLQLVGQIDIATQEDTLAALATLTESDPVVLDLGAVSFIDLAGFGPLLPELHRVARLTADNCSCDARTCLQLLARACPVLLDILPNPS